MRKTLFIFFIAILTLSLFISCEGDIDSALEAKITVTFDGNGSTDGEMAALKVKKGEDFKLTKNAFEKTDYIFTGWNTAADGSGTAYANEGTAKFDKDTILYAQWIEELTITFDGNGSTGGEMAALKVKKGENFKLTKNAFEKTDYIFTGWNTADDGSGTAYANEGTAKFDKDTTLYAQWSEELTITFNANDGSGTPATKTQKVGKGIATALDANTFTRTSYYFAGWSSSEEGAVEYADKANITLTGDKILYAVWSVNPVVTLTKGTGISEVTGSGSYAPGAVVTINATVADGYTWSKWTQTTGGADVSTTQEYSFTMGTENINYTANATANTYTVTLETNGGTIATGKDVTSYTYGVGATLPTASDITKSGNSFGGWYANSEYTGAAVTSISTTDTGDKIFYAKWIEELTITFNANDGSETPATKTQKVGKGIETALDANSFTSPDENYVFAGWTTDADGEKAYYGDEESVTLTEDLTLYAQWGSPLDSDSTTWTGGKYTLENDVSISSARINVEGNVKLFIPNGKTLTASQGIRVTGDYSLTINGNGSLIAGGTGTTLAYAAGIGGENGQSSGKITINGGTVIATGGAGGIVGNGGAGIGGCTGCDVGTVTINGGTVTAIGGSKAAGIGGGASGAGGTVTITGGSVTANGGENAAGIGGGYNGDGGTVTITGGTVTATGGICGAGIGGGIVGYGGIVTINGGAVTANGGNGGAGIGGGSGEAGGTVTINGGIVTANGGDSAVGIGAGGGSSSHGKLTIGYAEIQANSLVINDEWSLYYGDSENPTDHVDGPHDADDISNYVERYMNVTQPST